MELKLIIVADDTPVEVEKGWEPYRSAFDRGICYVLLKKEGKKTIESAPRHEEDEE